MMSFHAGGTSVFILVGLLVSLAGVLVIRYPEASYAVRTAWKHENPSLSSSGRTDQRVMGGIVLLIGVGLVLHGAF